MTEAAAQSPSEAPQIEPLPHLDENWERALVVVAHPDDIEYAAAAVARWTGQGKHISYCMITSGEAGIDALEPEVSRPIRQQEQRAAAAVVGVTDVEFLGYQDGVLEYGIRLRRDIAHVIRRRRPEIVLTNNFRETWDGTALNQADHMAAGRAVLDAARDAGNRWVFRDQLVDGLEPWPQIRAVWANASPQSTHGVDVTDTFEVGLESFRAHEQYLAGLGPNAPDPAEFLEGMFRAVGTRLGCRFGLAFEVFPLQLY